MTPLGHAATGLLAARILPPLSALSAVIGGLAPDADFLLFFRDDFNTLHRTFSHSLLFMAALTGIGFAVARSGHRRAVAGGLALGVGLHLLFDAILDGNPSNGVGVQLLWPFDETFYAPFNLLGFTHATAPATGWADWTAMLPGAMWALLIELALVLTLALAYKTVQRSRTAP